jgi:hypothetical protein
MENARVVGRRLILGLYALYYLSTYLALYCNHSRVANNDVKYNRLNVMFNMFKIAEYYAELSTENI